ncbi:mycofactocin-coupled SDR family oxidoreductase [Sphaerobacter thermophilus]|uniref:Short-chain dehydrogenase/reductase SDR n=1 Tax=Sphaerobacter thermophilus (strain ATCC 49802 / DSM 20745 / KCCM 41009 / NCIMB 13125 / S 6022) TaxID=479434 RepID=D1C8Y0_SPHTD|nr:mycofactocin-coupled SDR family oxidoreductase [Sphaerobacter thermophilus]ACZ40273.1 short-chain dehydrogenase/reductase SDR [Sphaerobacter thermophilus DSM 20745]
MGKLDGKVAVITGGARGQGRSHAVTLAREGADIVICDIAAQIDTVPYPMATPADMEETVRLVEDLDRRCVAVQADVRDGAQMQAVVDRVLSEFGKVDILLANAGISSTSTVVDMTDEQWRDMIDTNLTGVFNSIRAVLPHMIERRSGRIVATASMAGRVGMPNIAHYVAAKWGVIGLVKSVAMEVAQYGITVNAVCPTTVNTPMIHNDATYKLFRPDLENPTADDALAAFSSLNVLPIPWVEPEDISNAILFLISDDARYITGTAVEVAAGMNASNAA